MPDTNSTTPILVRASVFDDVDDKRIVTALVDEYVNPLLERGYYTRSELPAKALQAYHVDYYKAQVANGGHGQFMGNSGMEPLLISDVREGLRSIGIKSFRDIFDDLVRLWSDKPDPAHAIAGNFGFGVPAAQENDLNDRFMNLECYKTLMPANGRWIKSWPELQVLPDEKWRDAIEHLTLQNPQADVRKYARLQANLSRVLSEPLQVAAQLLGHKLGILPLSLSGVGDPAAKAPDGRKVIGWRVSSQQAPLIMFLDDRDALLCGQYLPDGRMLTYALMAKIRNQLLTKKDMGAATTFADVTSKELGRLPSPLIAEAIELAARSQIVAAAALVCKRLKDELQSVAVLEKSGEGIWSWRIRAKSAQYFLELRSRDILVMSAESKPMFPLSFDEVDEFARAARSGQA